VIVAPQSGMLPPPPGPAWEAGPPVLPERREDGLLDEVRHVASTVVGFGVGMILQGANELTRRVHIPFLGLPSGPPGEFVEPPGAAARDGADLVESIARAIAGTELAAPPQEMREARPLLARVSVDGRAGSTTRLEFRAAAPTASWGIESRAASLVAVYVDGRYHATNVVHGERDEPHVVNLGELAPGPHDVELRAAVDRAAEHAPIPVIDAVRSSTVGGLAALVDAHAPILQLRDTHGEDGMLEGAHDDAPLATYALVAHEPGGGVAIEYRIAFTNEDGGTPTAELMSQYGHTIDVEPVYRVRLDARGSIVESRYQTGIHQWREFDGDREALRPLLRVSSNNNMTSARVADDGAERWSDAPVVATSDAEVRRLAPWMRRVAELELHREGKVGTGGANHEQVAAPERYVAIGPVSDAQRALVVADGGLWLQLRRGGAVFAQAARDFASGEYQVGSVLLPPGVTRDEVRGR
jgi:hypothetical protein